VSYGNGYRKVDAIRIGYVYAHILYVYVKSKEGTAETEMDEGRGDYGKK
jgi:hypothetical protein